MTLDATLFDPELYEEEADLSPTHPQVRIRHGRLAAEVDEGIAPLILACWRAGIDTLHSCQGGKVVGEVVTRPYVHFPAVAAERFLRRIFDGLGNPLVDHVFGPDPDLEDEMTEEEAEAFERDHRWEWHVNAHPPWWEAGLPRPWLGVSVDFPAADLPEILRRLA